jgi:hypothetical protein
MTRHVLLPMLLCSVVGLAAPVGVARAEEPAAQAEGRAHFRRGVDFFKEGDYRAALIEFKRAYELAPNYKVLYNLGQTSLELQDYASALRSFEKYLADGAKDIPAARRTQVEAEVDRLKKRVARVEVTTNVPDAEIFIDDVSVGKTPLAPLAVSAGRRKFSASKGGITATRAVDLAGGDATSVALEIVEPTATTPAPAPTPSPARTIDLPKTPSKAEPVRSAPPPTPPPPEPSNTGLWIGITATGALAAGAVATGIFALSAKKDFDSTVGRYGVDTQSVNDARSKTRTLALVADILAGATILAGGVTLITALSSPATKEKERQHALRVDLTPGGLVARGTF